MAKQKLAIRDGSKTGDGRADTYREIKVMWYHRLLKVTSTHLSKKNKARVRPRTGIMTR